MLVLKITFHVGSVKYLVYSIIIYCRVGYMNEV